MVSSDGGLIQVIDDEAAIRRSLAFMLRAAGYRVECWADGAEFLDRADKTIPACVLLDIRMPTLEGFAVQERMAEHGLHFPVIMMTGHGDVGLAVRALMGGALDFIEKPFDREKLLRSVAMAFEHVAHSVSVSDEAATARLQIARLTATERDVLDGLACGYPNSTIADDLGLSLRAVQIHRANMMTILQITYFADALRIAFRGGLGVPKAWQDRHAGLMEAIPVEPDAIAAIARD